MTVINKFTGRVLSHYVGMISIIGKASMGETTHTDALFAVRKQTDEL